MGPTNTKIFPLDSAACKEKRDPSGDVIERLVSGYISKETVDMDKDVVLTSGVDTKTYFDSTRAVNLDHMPKAVVGTNRELAIRPGQGIYALTYVSKSSLGEDVFTMIQEKVIRGMSVEWDPRTLQAGPPTDQERLAYPGVKRVFRQWTLTGYAFTARPCNPQAVIDGVKSASYLAAMEPAWIKMEQLVSAGKIHLSSAHAAGFPVEPRAVAVRSPRTALVAGGKVWTR